MSIVVNHDERKREILRKSLILFARHGYADVTFQNIADECGLARTALYKYFHHKQLIFDGAVTMATNDLIVKYREIASRPGTYRGKTEALLEEVLKVLFAQRDLLLVIAEYTIAVKRSGKTLRGVVSRHTRGLKAVLRYLLLKGVRAGEFAPMDVRANTEILYALMETAVLRLTLSDSADMDRMMTLVRLTLDHLPQRKAQKS